MIKKVVYIAANQLKASWEIVVKKIYINIKFQNQIIVYFDYDLVLTLFF